MATSITPCFEISNELVDGGALYKHDYKEVFLVCVSNCNAVPKFSYLGLYRLLAVDINYLDAVLKI